MSLINANGSYRVNDIHNAFQICTKKMKKKKDLLERQVSTCALRRFTINFFSENHFFAFTNY